MNRPLSLVLGFVVLPLAIAGCGAGSDVSSTPPPEPAPSATPADFPSAAGKTLMDLQQEASQGPVLAPSVSLLYKGPNRYGFALFDSARKQVPGAQVAIYTARNDGSGVKGPYIARSESLAVKPQFQSETTARDPDAAKSVYVATVPFSHNGKQVVTALVRLGGRLLATNSYAVEVGQKGGPPRAGQRAIKVETPTLTSVAGDASRIDTRRPAATDLLQDNLANVLGKRPVVITFATPLLCQSRVCGPVVDIVEQAKATAPKNVAFIHQEIYKDNQVNHGPTAPVAAWRLRSEPWTFVIDRRGRIVQRFEGAFSVGELQRAIAKVST